MTHGERLDAMAAETTALANRLERMTDADLVGEAHLLANMATFSHNDWIAAVHALQRSNLCLVELLRRKGGA